MFSLLHETRKDQQADLAMSRRARCRFKVSVACQIAAICLTPVHNPKKLGVAAATEKDGIRGGAGGSHLGDGGGESGTRVSHAGHRAVGSSDRAVGTIGHGHTPYTLVAHLAVTVDGNLGGGHGGLLHDNEG